MKNGVYVEAQQIESGYGYWIKVVDDCVINIKGQKLTAREFPTLTKGWNMIGAPGDPTVFDSMKGLCVNEKGPLWYDPSIGNYVSQDTLQPGRGYFVKVSESCKLGGEAPPPLPQ
jgi:predicted RNA-binding protein YlxR (DUF448 family)